MVIINGYHHIISSKVRTTFSFPGHVTYELRLCPIFPYLFNKSDKLTTNYNPISRP